MKSKFSQDEIFNFWQQQAKIFGLSYQSSWSDFWAIYMEIKTILMFIKDNERILDVGCGCGFTDIEIAKQKNVKILGIDYVPEMIKAAKERLAHCNTKLKKRIDFKIGNILDLNEYKGDWDKLIAIRVLINLGTWENQKKALEECASILKRGALFLLSEATLQGYKNLNRMRTEFGLEELTMPPFNLYLDENKVVKEASKYFKLIDILNFSSTYYIGTRVIKPILSKCMNKDEMIANPLTEWNRFFSFIPSLGDYGIQKLFIFEKK